MKVSADWRGGYRTLLTDERGHQVTVDLAPDEGGLDSGPSALELAVLSLAGCITTIFALVAKKRRLEFDQMTVDLEAARPRGARTVTAVNGTFRIRSPATVEEVATALRLTLRTCPVGVLFEEAHIPVHVEPIVEEPAGSSLGGPRELTAATLPRMAPPPRAV